MNKKTYYTQPQIIDKPIGNNAFSYDKRKAQWSSCVIHTPTIVEIERNNATTNLDNLITLGNAIVFEEINEQGTIQSSVWLQHIYTLHKKGKPPLYIMDNHNHALYLRSLAYQQKRLGAWASLIHIDQHADMGVPETAIDRNQCDISSDSFWEEQLTYIANYTNEVCNVGNFIQPTQEIGLISDITQVRTVAKLEEIARDTNVFAQAGKTIESNDSYVWDISREEKWQEHKQLWWRGKSTLPSIILDIDIDFFVDHEPHAQEREAMKALYQTSSICTIALSPYFMDIFKAKKTTEMILSCFLM